MNKHCRRCSRSGPAHRPGRWYVCPRPPAPAVADDPDGGAPAFLRWHLLDAGAEPSRDHVQAILVRARRLVRRRRLRDGAALTVLIVASALLGLALGSAL
ncbi:hypothetical protein COUCH_22215 [Couchioplanes caeruleus]|uniref:hypothetical protein n=1 Tax=Couchioplanes caeruleus TaxID=56438 RepID=UPI0020C09652|nr:hypothetical protein [Couchioplanes caeruleus]UQU61756.1 hypothetical protein COUCH_22215 [Couchioplanes caeruleus]